MLEKLVPLFDGYMVFYEQNSDPDKYRVFLKDRIDNDESVIFMALNEEGIGMGFTQLYPSFSSVSQSRIFVLNDLYVEYNFRRMGVAQKLMAAAEEFGKENGAIRLHLETSDDNYDAQKLYEKENWVKDSGFYHYVKFLR